MGETFGKDLTEEQLDQVADVAMRLISRYGWRSVSVRDVAEEAEVPYPVLRRSVLDKEGILTLVLERRDVVDIRTIRKLWHGESLSAKRRLHDLVAHNATQPEIIRLYVVLAGEAIEPSHPAHDYFKRRYQESVDIMSDIVRGSVSDPDATGVHIIAMMDGLQLQWLRDPDAFDLVAEWDRAADLILV